jgi:hypothetical protein
MRSLRFPYIDQMTNPALPAGDRIYGESAQSPVLSYKSNADFPLKVKNAAFFVSFPPNMASRLDMCLWWLKNGGVYKSKCIDQQGKDAFSNYEGYGQLLDLDWDIPPGDELYGGCTYYGAEGSNGDCVAYAYVQLPDDKRTYQGVFTSYGLIDPNMAHVYCYDTFNAAWWTSNPALLGFATEVPERCMSRLRLYDPLEVTLLPNKTEGYVGGMVNLSADHKRGRNPEYKFWYNDSGILEPLGGWSANPNFTAQIQKQGINQYVVWINETNRPVEQVAYDHDAENSTTVWGNPRLRADSNPPYGCISNQELLAFMDLWKTNSTAYPLREMMGTVGLWKAPC